ncbi:MAG: biopolymer transporter ExbD [Pirellulales bacterium]
MQLSTFNLAPSDSDELIARRPDQEPPEFDITAMVDLVFMMNIYFLVTFITVALGELNLPSADYCTPLDADTAVIVSMVRSLDGKSVTVYLGDGDKGEPLNDGAEQERRVQAAVEEGVADGKTAVLLKAEKKVRLADMFRIANAASIEGVQLHVAVLEKDVQP